jgi:molecular chaperone DnaK (HSP70)
MDIERKMSGTGMIDAGQNLLKDLGDLANVVNSLDSKVKDAKNNLSDNNMRNAESLITDFKKILDEMKKGMEDLSEKLKKVGKRGQHIERSL